MLAFIAPRNIVMDGTGIIYISDFGAHRVYKMTTDGTLTTLAGTGSPGYSGDGVAALEYLNYPTALAVDHQGTVYIADSGNHLIRKVAGGIPELDCPVGAAYRAGVRWGFDTVRGRSFARRRFWKFRFTRERRRR